MKRKAAVKPATASSELPPSIHRLTDAGRPCRSFVWASPSCDIPQDLINPDVIGYWSIACYYCVIRSRSRRTLASFDCLWLLVICHLHFPLQAGTASLLATSSFKPQPTIDYKTHMSPNLPCLPSRHGPTLDQRHPNIPVDNGSMRLCDAPYRIRRPLTSLIRLCPFLDRFT